MEVFKIAKELAEMVGIVGEQAVLSADQATHRITGRGILEDVGLPRLASPDNTQLLNPTEIGKVMGGLSARRVNRLLVDAGLQRKAGSKWMYTAKGKPYAVVVDTTKRSSQGSPVTQLRWKDTVIPLLVEQLPTEIDDEPVAD